MGFCQSVSAYSSLAFVVVREPLNIVFTKIIATLDFDEYQRFVANIGYAVFRPEWNDEDFAGAMIGTNIVERESRRPGDDHPKLLSTLMALVREPRAGVHRDALHLMRISALEDVVPTPGSDVF